MVRKSAMMSRTRASIGCQSCTQTPHIGENAFERVDDFRPLRRILHAFDMKVDETFALAADRARALEVDELAGEVALDHEYRMDEQANIEAALIELGRRRNRPGTAYRH